jgi:hypothetical protein
VDARHARGAGGGRVGSFGSRFRLEDSASRLQKFVQVRDHHVANEFIVVTQPVFRGNENQLDRVQGDSDGDGDDEDDGEDDQD